MAYQRNTNQTFTNETQKLAMDDVVILISIYALDRNGELTNFPTYNLTPSVQEDEIVSFWFTEKSRALGFSPFPVEVSQVENSAASSLPRPQMTLSNLSSIFDIKPESLVGGRVEIRQTFKKYLWGNEQGKAGSCLPVESYVIDRLAGETFETLVYELAAPYDLEAVKLPRRRIVGGQCPWKYKGASIDNFDSPADPVRGSEPRGGCTFPRSNQLWTGSRYTTVNMSPADEYIIDSRLITTQFNLIPEDVPILKDSYVFTYANAYEIDQYGIQLASTSSIQHYWQATKDMIVPEDKETPRDGSSKWRQVRVYSAYDKTKYYKGYADKRNNEYVSQLATDGFHHSLDIGFSEEPITSTIGGAFEALYLTPGATGRVHAISIDEDIALSILNGEAYSIRYQRTESVTALGTVLSRDDTKRTIYTAPRLISFNFAFRNELNAGLEQAEATLWRYNDDQYYILVGLGDITDENISFQGANAWISRSENLPFSQVYQVASRSVDPNLLATDKHTPFREVGQLEVGEIQSDLISEYWKRGDSCSKTLNACVLRFGASEIDLVTDVTQPGDSIFEYEFDVSNPDNQAYFRIPNNVEPFIADQDGWRVDSDVYSALGDEGYVAVSVFIDGNYVQNWPYWDTSVSKCQALAAEKGIFVYYPGQNGIFNRLNSGTEITQPSVTGGLSFNIDTLYFMKMENEGTSGMASTLASATGYFPSQHNGPFTPSGRKPFWTPASVYNMATGPNSNWTDGILGGFDGFTFTIWDARFDMTRDWGVGTAEGRVWYRDSARLGTNGLFLCTVPDPIMDTSKAIVNNLIPSGAFGGGSSPLNYSANGKPRLFGPTGEVVDACVDANGNSVRFSFSASSSPQTTASTSVVRSSVAIPFGGFPGSRRFK